jgi:hypothetical protein
MLADELHTVLNLKEKLAERVVGQDQALDAIAKRVRTSRADLDDPGKPVGVFLLIVLDYLVMGVFLLIVLDYLAMGVFLLMVLDYPAMGVFL